MFFPQFMLHLSLFHRDHSRNLFYLWRSSGERDDQQLVSDYKGKQRLFTVEMRCHGVSRQVVEWGILKCCYLIIHPNMIHLCRRVWNCDKLWFQNKCLIPRSVYILSLVCSFILLSVIYLLASPCPPNCLIKGMGIESQWQNKSKGKNKKINKVLPYLSSDHRVLWRGAPCFSYATGCSVNYCSG